MPLQCPRCRRTLDFCGDRPSFCAYCGHALAATDAFTPPTDEAATLPPPAPSADGEGDPPEAVGGYRLVRKLGEGGMGSVWEAEEPGTRRRVAVKLIAAGGAAEPEALERFRREGRLASQLAHPRCVFVLAADEDAGRPYIAMELMPGDTLADLVRRRGPLPVVDAIKAILDVLDGLREAHALGLVHRDVKPSNCFLEADGRVKIGDFGLARPVAVSARLTGTGVFLGTPLFASPEQIKQEALDARSDVYSLAATLYFLLAGRAPFETDNAALALARIVSDPPPPLRDARPDVPPTLERVIARGLERDRDRRWPNLDEFRAALLPFVPDVLSIGGVGLRLGACLIDLLVVNLPFVPPGVYLAATEDTSRLVLGLDLSCLILAVMYFTVLEGRWGASLGKRLIRLRVCTAGGGEAPGLRRAFVRTLIFAAIIVVPPQVSLPTPPGFDPETWELVDDVALPVCGGLVLLTTMLLTKGYRGPHELLSGTRVLRLPWPVRRRLLTSRRDNRPAPARLLPDGLPEKVGVFRLRGVVCWSDRCKIVAGEDPALGRAVWVEFSPGDEPAPDARRRDLSRPTRSRWLAGGRHGGWLWDAYLAPPGRPLADLVGEGDALTWTEARPILQQLADELCASRAEGSLPLVLTVDQVWVQEDGRLTLLDWPVTGGGASEETAPATEEGRSLALLRDTATRAVEGRSWRSKEAALPSRLVPCAVGALLALTSVGGGIRFLLPIKFVTLAFWDVILALWDVRLWLGVVCVTLALGAFDYSVRAWRRRPRAVRAAVPAHAAALLDRLFGARPSYRTVEEFRADLAATADRPTEVGTSIRAGQLALATTFLLFGIVCMFLGSKLVTGFAVSALADYVRHTRQALRLLEDGSLKAFVFDRMGPEETREVGWWLEELDRDGIVARYDDPTLRRVWEFQRSDLATRLSTTNALSRAVLNDDLRLADRLVQGEVPDDLPALTLDDLVTTVDAAVSWSRLGENMVPPFYDGAVKGGAPFILGWPVLFWVAAAFAFRGGLSYRLMGVELMSSSGYRALRLQCAWRALLIWAPITTLLVASLWLDVYHPGRDGLSWGLWWVAVGVLASYVVLALRYPARGPHDWLAGTRLVPR